ncbi:MAG: hypothetical protein JWN44_2430 [Myxococcales bacterium]|nr:hypothetical protein [Myxococcales bacterium]
MRRPVPSIIIMSSMLALAACTGRVDKSSGDTPSTLSGSPGSALPAGPLSTRGNQIVDKSGTPVRIASVGWNEIGAGPIQGIAANLDAIGAAGFNAVRVSWVNATMAEDLARIDEVVGAAGPRGIKVILDNHTNEPGHGPQDNWGAQQKNGLWYDVGGASDGTDGGGNPGTVTDAKFLADWKAVATHYRGNDTVIGYDLRNEPLAYGGMSTWGDGNLDTDLRAMYQRVGNAIVAIDAGKLIICEGPQNYGGNFAGNGVAPWGDLSLAGQRPVVLSVPNKVVYSVHDYPHEISGISNDSGAGKIAQMNADWGYLVSQKIAPVWVGEMGSSMDDPGDDAWAQTLVSYLNGGEGGAGGPTFSGDEQGIGGDWWAWGYLAGQLPDGTQNSDGSLRANQRAVWSQLLYHATTGAPHVIRVAVGQSQAYVDPAGNSWSADTGFQGGIGFTLAPPVPIAGTDAAPLYNGERYGSDGNGNAAAFRYAFAMAAGNYNVTLKFAEYYVTGVGERQFDVSINGNKVLTNFDILAAAGGANKAVDRSFAVSLPNDGTVTIELSPGAAQNPKVDAIAILPSDGPPPPPPPPDGAPLIVPPLVGATPGAWQSGDLDAAGMRMHYNYLLPHGYSDKHRYPVLLWLHENDMGNSVYNGGDPTGLASYLDGWFNTSAFRTNYPCIIIAPYADQRSDPGGATSNWGGWVPPGDHGPNEDAAAAITQYFVQHFSAYPRKVYVSGASLGGHGSWAMMLDYNAWNGPFGKIFAAGMPLAGVIERYGFGVDPPGDVVDRMRNVPVFAVHGSGDGTSQPNWDRAMWHDYGGGALPGNPGAQSPGGAYRYLEDPGLGHDVWDTYYALPAGKPLYDWMFAQTAP